MQALKFAIALFVSIALCGCTNRYQHQVDQSLLLQENQRLEEALYVTHAQLVDLKRENETLRAARGVASSTSSSASPVVRPKRAEFAPRDDYDEAPPFEPPKVEIPSNVPGSTTLPDLLKSSRAVPILPSPRSKPATPDAPPELLLPSADDTTFPVWTPTR